MSATGRYECNEEFWIYIPEGLALLGADSPGEGPVRSLNIPSLCVARYTTTNREFAAFIQDAGYRRREFWTSEGWEWIQSEHVAQPAFWFDDLFNQPDQPVTGVSFYEADAYARWRSARLPTELEWEKAARGTQGARYPWGEDEPNASRANFAPGFVPLNRSPVEVQDCAAGDSPYGCRQMAGNVHEWCQDYFQVDTPAFRSSANLVEIRSSRRRVLKGGCWGSGAARLRPSARWSSPAHLRDNVVGFRLARDQVA